MFGYMGRSGLYSTKLLWRTDMGACRISRGKDVSTPQPGDPKAVTKPRRGMRKRSMSVRVAKPEWACNVYAAQPNKVEDKYEESVCL
jgi:hypothetical protein